MVNEVSLFNKWDGATRYLYIKKLASTPNFRSDIKIKKIKHLKYKKIKHLKRKI